MYSSACANARCARREAVSGAESVVAADGYTSGTWRVHAGVATGPGRQEEAEARADVHGQYGSDVIIPRGGKGPRESKDVGGQGGGKRGQPLRHSYAPAAAAPPSSLPRPSARCRTPHRARVTPRARSAARASFAPPVAPAVEAGRRGTPPCGGAAPCERVRGGREGAAGLLLAFDERLVVRGG